MNTRGIAAAVVVGALLVGLGRTLASPSAAESPQPAGRLDKKALIDMIRHAGGPVVEHKLLEPMIGTFDCEVRLTPAPGTPPIVARCESSARWILDNRFIELTGHPQQGEELPLESMQIFGYDKRSRQFFCWAIDSTDTYGLLCEGDYDSDSKTLTLLGEAQDAGLVRQRIKQVIHFDTADQQTSQVWIHVGNAPGADADGWFRSVEIIAKRKKG